MTLRIGIVGLGANTRLRHVPGLRACEGVELVAVSNRRAESTRAAADEYGIPKTYSRWEDLVADPQIDAVMIGTWPYLHAPIAIAALQAGKHVLTEARMAMDAAEAHRMRDAAQARPDLTARIVPSPFGLRGRQAVQQMLDEGYLGALREVVILGCNDALSDPQTPLHWRQRRELSGVNMLALGILHETLLRWVPDPVSVLAQTAVFTPQRPEGPGGPLAPVTTPDSVHVLAELPGGARALYHLSGVLHFGPAMQMHLYGSQGTIKYVFTPEEHLWAGQRGDSAMHEVPLPDEATAGWRVERDFVEAIGGAKSPNLPDFALGVRYMEFTDAVARSAERRTAVGLRG